MNARRRAAGCAVLFLCASAAGAAALPDAVRIVYILSRGAVELGRVEETFTRHGHDYRIVSEATAVGLAAVLARGQGWRRESRGTITAEGLRPDRYSDQRGNRPVQVTQFDWEARQVVFEREGSRESIPLPGGGVHDRLSLAWGFGYRAPGWEQRHELVVRMAEGRSVGEYVYAIVGRERLRTPAGEFETLHLSRPRDDRHAGIDLWLATGRRLLPVRIVVTEPDGQVFEQVAIAISP